MKQLASYSIFFLLLIILNSVACDKGHSNKTYLPPVANAGPDQLIVLPVDSVKLDGSGSSDPDGTIRHFNWTKISGPSGFISSPSSPGIVVRYLTPAKYDFQLEVTDNDGLSSKDTVSVMVIVDSVNNHPPVASAGPDQLILLPTDETFLNGSGSTDPDNNITSYTWTKVAGPSSYYIIYTNSIQPGLTNLTEGIYLFELKVVDAGGLLSRDTVQVTVSSQLPVSCGDTNRELINAQLIPVGTLSQSRIAAAVVSAGGKIFFAGGYKNGVIYSRVDIYDVTTNTWSAAELSIGRTDIAAVSAGNKVFFAGGDPGDATWLVDNVDVYDLSTNTWSIDHLSIPGSGISAATVGNKVFFAGGFGGQNGPGRETRVDIFDLNTNTWSIASLSEPKVGSSPVTVNNKIYFAGGGTSGSTNCGSSWSASNRIDIYDNSTNTWSTSFMQEGKTAFAAIEKNGKIYWAGGSTGTACNWHESCLVEIKDVNTGADSIANLFRPGLWVNNNGQNAACRDDKIVFFWWANKFDIYDINLNTWSIGVLPISIQSPSIITVNNIIYVSDGNQVWRMEF